MPKFDLVVSGTCLGVVLGADRPALAEALIEISGNGDEFAAELASLIPDDDVGWLLKFLEGLATEIRIQKDLPRAVTDLAQFENALRAVREKSEAEVLRLREALKAVETATATPDGLNPNDTIRLHLNVHAALGNGEDD